MKYKRIRQITKAKKAKKLKNVQLWNLDTTLARIIASGVYQFARMERYGIPNCLIDGNKIDCKQEKELCKQWDAILNEIVWTFSEIADDYPNSPIDAWLNSHKETADKRIPKEVFESVKAYKGRIANGKQLFVKAFDDLWD